MQSQGIILKILATPLGHVEYDVISISIFLAASMFRVQCFHLISKKRVSRLLLNFGNVQGSVFPFDLQRES
jgi:hypothetical protein